MIYIKWMLNDKYGNRLVHTKYYMQGFPVWCIWKSPCDQRKKKTIPDGTGDGAQSVTNSWPTTIRIEIYNTVIVYSSLYEWLNTISMHRTWFNMCMCRMHSKYFINVQYKLLLFVYGWVLIHFGNFYCHVYHSSL